MFNGWLKRAVLIAAGLNLACFGNLPLVQAQTSELPVSIGPVPEISIASEYRSESATEISYYLLASTAPEEKLSISYEAVYESTDGSSDETAVSMSADLTGGSRQVRLDVDLNNGPGTILDRVEVVSGDGYSLGTEYSSSLPSIAMQDSPLLRISSDVTSVVEGEPIVFEVEAVPGAAADTEVEILVSQTAGRNYIEGTFGNGPAQLTKTLTSAAGRVSFPVGTWIDGNNALDGTITATIQPSPNSGYVLGSVTSSASVHVRDNGLPILSISDAPDTDESSAASFTVTSDKLIRGSLNVRYKIFEVDAGDFLDDSVQNEIKTASLRFFRNRENEPYTAALKVLPDDDSVDETDGSIEVGLWDDSADPLTYTVKSTERYAFAAVADNDVPVLSVANAPSVIESNSAVAEFKIISATKPMALTLQYRISEVGDGSFLPNEAATVGIVPLLSFSQSNGTGPYFTTISVPIDNDRTDEADGQIRLTLESPPDPGTYSVNNEFGSATAEVIDDDIPELELVQPTGSFMENEAVEVKVVADILPHQPLTVSYKAFSGLQGEEFVATSYLEHEPTLNSATLSFANDGTGTFASILRIPLDDDNLDEPDSNLFVELETDPTDSGSYVPSADAEAVAVTVMDNDVPVISISAPAGEENAVVESDWEDNAGYATFILTAVGAIHTESVDIQYTPSEVGDGDFLASATEVGMSTGEIAFNYSPGSTTEGFTREVVGGEFTATLTVPLENDSVKEDGGSVMVTLNPDTSGRVDYTVSDTQSSATVDVIDDDLPIISVLPYDGTLIESEELVLRFKSNVYPVNDNQREKVYFKMTNVEGDFLGDLHDQEGLYANLRFFSSGIATGYLAVDKDSVREPDGSIKFQLLPDTDGELSYVLDEENSSLTINVADDDSVAGAPQLYLTDWNAENGLATVGSEPAKIQVNSNINISGTLNVRLYRWNISGAFIDNSEPQVVTYPVAFNGTKSGIANVALVDASGYQEPGSIGVSLIDSAEVSGSLASYYIRPSRQIVRIEIFDGSIPTYSIESPTDPAREDRFGSFTVKSTLPFNGNQGVNFTRTNIEGDFLGIGDGDFGWGVLTPNPVGSRTGELVVGFHDDNVDEPEGVVMVTLNPDDQVPPRYIVSETANTAMVTVKDDDIPLVSIANGTGVSESEQLTFPLQASILPWKPLKIKYRIIETSGSFLIDSTANHDRVAEVEFIKQSGTNQGFANPRLDVLDDDSLIERDGTLEIVLSNSGIDGVDFDNDGEVDYKVYYSMSAATVNVRDDDKPVIRISAQPTVEEGGRILGKIIGSTGFRNLELRFTPYDEVGQFVSIDPGVTRYRNWSSDNNNTAIFDIRTRDNSIHEQNGLVRISIEENPEHYSIDSNHGSVTVEVINNDLPELSVVELGEYSKEGEQGGITVLSDRMPYKPLLVSYRLDNRDGDYLGSLAGSTQQSYLTFTESDGVISAELPVETDDDSKREAPGSANVTLLASEHYYVAEGMSTGILSVYDNDAMELILEDATEAADESGRAVFKVIGANASGPAEFNVSYTPVNAEGDFLGISAGMARTARLSFTFDSETSEYAAELPVELDDDSVDEANGRIRVTINSDPEGAIDYFPPVDSTGATAEVSDNDVPEISIAPASEVSENDILRFKLISNIRPQALAVRHTLSEVSGGDYLIDEMEQTRTSPFLTFTRSPEGNQYITTLTVFPDDDYLDEPDGQIMVALENDLADPATYAVSDISNSATASVTDDDSPVLSVIGESSPDTPTEVKKESDTLEFTVRASRMPYRPPLVNYRLTYDSVNFIGSIANTIRREQLNFTRDEFNTVSAILSVPLVESDSVVAEGNVHLELLDDTLDPAAYIINGRNTGTFTVRHDAPEISISDAPEVSESGPVLFPITATKNAAGGLRIRYRPSDTSGNFLPDYSMLPLTSETVAFIRSEDGNGYVGTLQVMPEDDGIAESHGSITVALDQDSNVPETYTLSETLPTEASANVMDNDIPTLSLSLPDVVVPPYESREIGASFKIGTDIFPILPSGSTGSDNTTLDVYYTPRNEEGNYLGDSSGETAMARVVFTRTEVNGSTVINAWLYVPLHDDAIGEKIGRINVTLEDDRSDPPRYAVDSATRSASLWVRDNDGGNPLPELSILDAQDVSENESAMFTVHSRTDAGTLDLKFRVDGDFVGAGSGAVQPLQRRTFVNSGQVRSYTTTLEVPLDDDQLREGSGRIAVTLLPTAEYAVVVGKDAATAKVYDNDAPELSIADAEPVTESGIAVFTVTANFNPGENLNVLYTPTSVEGDFLGTNSGIPTTATLNFMDDLNSLTAALTVNLEENSIHEPDGSIMVTLNSDTIGRLDYTVSAEAGSATAAVTNDDFPVLSIENAAGITEGERAAFPIKASIQPAAPLRVRYAPGHILTNDFLGAASGRDAFTLLTFSENSEGEFKSILQVDTIDNLSRSQDGSFFVIIKSDADGTKDYEVSDTNSSARVQVRDNEIPELSITAPKRVSENVPFNMTVVSTRDPYGPLNLRYKLENVDGDYLGAGSGTEQSVSSSFRSFGTEPLQAYRSEVELSLEDDLMDESQGSVRITLLENPGIYSVDGTTNVTTVAVTDDDIPILSIADAVGVHEDGAALFRVTSNIRTELPLAVYHTRTNLDGDFLGRASGQSFVSILSFSDNGNGTSSANLAVEMDDDTTDEPDGSVRVVLNPDPSGIGSYSVSSSDRATVQVADNDSLPVLSIRNSIVEESAGRIRFAASLNRASERTVTVEYVTVDGTALGGEDYTPIPVSQVSFGPGETVKSIDVNLNNDPFDENLETFALEFSNPVNAVFAGDGSTAEAYGTIRDDDAKPELSIESASGEENEGSLTFAVALETDSNREVRVSYATRKMPSDTAAVGRDYSQAIGTLRFTAGETGRTFTVDIADDSIQEANETFTVTLFNPVGATVRTGTAIGTIVNDDSGPIIASLGDEMVHTDEDLQTLAVPVTLSRASDSEVTVMFAAESGTAESGTDFSLPQNQLVIPAGQRTGDISISVVDDSLTEPDETFQLNLTGAEGASLSNDPGLNSATIVIHDSESDNKPVISIGRGLEMITEGEQARFLIYASKAPPVPLSVRIELSEGADDFIDMSAGGLSIGQDERLVSKVELATSHDLNSGIALEFETIDDSIGEPDGMLTATVLEGQGYAISASGSNSSIGILDNDWPLVSIDAMNPDSVAEGSDAVFRVTATPRPAVGTLLPVKLSVSETGGWYLKNPEGERTVHVTRTGTYDHREPTKSFNLSDAVPGDPFFESDPAVIAEIAEGEGYHRDRIPGSASATIGILDDEIRDTVISIADSSITAEEGSDTTEIIFELELNNSIDNNAKVDAVVSGGTATAGEDFELTASRVAFEEDSTGTITVTVLDDDLIEDTETFTLSLTAVRATFANGTSTAVVTGTIVSNDVPEVSISTRFDSVSDADYFEIEVTSDQPPVRSTEVHLDFADADGVVAGTYSPVTLGPGETAKVVRVEFNKGLAAIEYGSAVAVSIGAGSGDYAINPDPNANSFSVQVMRSDTLPEVSILSDGAASEGHPAYFRIVATDSAGHSRTDPLTVNVRVVNGAGNYIAGTPAGTVTVGPNEESVMLDVATEGDSTAGGNDGLIEVELLPGNGYKLTPEESLRIASVIVLDNGGTTEISILNAAKSIREDAGEVSFDLRLTAPSNGTVEVSFADFLTGTATPTEDYTLPSSPIEIAGTARSASILVAVADDAVNEGDEEFILDLAATGAAFVGGTSTAEVSGTIIDNDPLPSVTVTSPKAREDNEEGTLEFSVSLSAASGRTVSIGYQVDASSTADESDYSIGAEGDAFLVIPAGETTGTIALSLTDDDAFELDETVILNLTATNAEFGPGVQTATATGTILQDSDGDTRPVISIYGPDRVVENAGSFEVVLTADTAPIGGMIEITTLMVADSPDSVGGYFDGSSPVTVEIDGTGTGTATIPVSDDGEYRGWGELEIVLSETNEYKPSDGNSNLFVTVEDDETASVLVSVLTIGDAAASGFVTEGESFDFVLTADRLLPEGESLQVEFAVVDSGNAGNYFASHTPGTTVITHPSTFATVSVFTLDDDEYNGDGEITVEVLRGNNYEVGMKPFDTVQVKDNEPDPSLPSVSVSVGRERVVEGSPISVTLTVSPVPMAGESIDVTTLKAFNIGNATRYLGSLTPDNPVPGLPGAIRIGDSGVATATITTADSMDFMGDGQIRITLSDTGAYTANRNTDEIEVTVVDEDNPDFPELSVESVRLASDATTPVASGSEGDAFLFVIRSSETITGQDLPVSFSVSQTGDFVGTAINGPEGQIEATGTYNGVIAQDSNELIVTVGTVEDLTDERDGFVTLTIERDIGYRVVATSDKYRSVTVMDNDFGDTVLTLVNAASTGTEGTSATLSFGLTLENPHDSSVSVVASVSGGTAVESEDYRIFNRILNFGNGVTNGTITVTIADDDLVEEDETFTLMLSSSNADFAGGSSTATVTGTIRSEDVPEVSVSTDFSAVSDKDYFEFTVTADQAPVRSTDVILDFEDADGVVATANSPVTLEPGETSRTRRVEFNPNAARTGEGSAVSVSIGPGSTDYAIDPDPESSSFTVRVVSGYILPEVSISADGSASEGYPAIFRIDVSDPGIRERRAPLVLRINAFNAAGEYISGTPASSVEVPPDVDSVTYKVETTGDSTAGGRGGLITARLLPGPGYQLAGNAADRSANVSVLDNGGAFEITVLNASGMIAETPGGAEISYDLRLSRPSDGTVSVTFADTTSGTATFWDDFTFPSLPIAFAESERSVSASVTVVDDLLDENEETFSLKLTAIGAAFSDGSSTTELTGTVTDDDPLPTVSVSSPEVREDAASGRLEFEVTLSRVSGRDVSIGYSVDGTGTATAGTDYSISGSNGPTLQIPAGGTSGTISLELTDDDEFELDENVVLSLTATNAEFGPGVQTGIATGKILQDDDVDVRTVISMAGPSRADESAGSFNVALTAVPAPVSGSFQITTLMVSESSDSAGGYFGGQSPLIVEINSSGVGIATVPVNDDTEYRGWGELEITLTETIDYRPAEGSSTLLVAIEDDEIAPVSISAELTGNAATAASVDEGDSFDVLLTASRDLESGESIQIELSADDSGNVGGYFGGFRETTAVITHPSRTATITALTKNDNTFRGDGEVTVEVLRGNSYEVGSPASVSVAVKDNEPNPALPRISVSADPVRVIEGGTFKVRLTVTPVPQPGESIEVTSLSVADSGAVSDYFASITPDSPVAGSPGSIFIGDTGSATATVATRDISGFNGDGRIRITLADSDEYLADRSANEIEVAIVDEENSDFPELHIESVLSESAASSPSVKGSEGDVYLFRVRSSETIAGKDLPVVLTVSQTGDFVGAASRGRKDQIQSIGTSIQMIPENSNEMIVAVGTVDDSVDEQDGSLTLEIERGLDYRLSQTHGTTVTVNVRDNDTGETVISVENLSMEATEGEGGEETVMNFSLSLANPHGGKVSVAARVLGGTATRNRDYRFDSETLDFGEGTELEIPLYVLDDSESEDNETARILLSATGAVFQYGEPNVTLSGTIIDNDRQTRISISSEVNSVTEGDTIVFSLHASPPPVANLPVRLHMIQTGGNVFQPLSDMMMIGAGQSMKSFKIQTVENNDPKNEGKIRIRVIEQFGYQTGDGENRGVESVEVRILNRQDQSEGTPVYSVAGNVISNILTSGSNGRPVKEPEEQDIELSLFAVKDSVQEGEPAQFRISSSQPVTGNVTVSVEIAESGDFIGGVMFTSPTIDPKTDSKVFEIRTIDDDLAESDGTVTATIREGNKYKVSANSSAEVKILDDSDRDAKSRQFDEATEQVLPEVLAHTESSLMDAVTGRITRSFSSDTSTGYGAFSDLMATDLLKTGGDSLNDPNATLKSTFEDDSFSVDLYPEDGGINSATVWGLTDRSDLSVNGSGSQSTWSGDSFTGHLGFDTRFDQGLLAGTTVTLSESDIEYDEGNENQLSFNSLSTGVSPYFGYANESRDAQIHVVSSIGMTDIKISERDSFEESAESSYYSLGVSGRKLLHSMDGTPSGGTSELNANLESWISRQSIVGNNSHIKDMQVSVGFYGIELEGLHSRDLDGFGEVKPLIQLGLRGYDWNGYVSHGLLLSTGAGFSSPTGLNLETSAYLEVSEYEKVQRKGFVGALDYDHGADRQGGLLNISSSWGHTNTDSSGMMHGENFLGRDLGHGNHVEGFIFDSEIGYGFNLWDEFGILTPHLGVSLDGNGIVSQYIGKEFTSSDSGLELNIEASRNTASPDMTENEFSINGTVKW